MTLMEMQRAIDENPGKSFVLAFPVRFGWDLTVGASNQFIKGLWGNVLKVRPPLVYFEVNTHQAKVWMHHVAKAIRIAGKRV